MYERIYVWVWLCASVCLFFFWLTKCIKYTVFINDVRPVKLCNAIQPPAINCVSNQLIRLSVYHSAHLWLISPAPPAPPSGGDDGERWRIKDHFQVWKTQWHCSSGGTVGQGLSPTVTFVKNIFSWLDRKAFGKVAVVAWEEKHTRRRWEIQHSFTFTLFMTGYLNT